MKITIIFPDRPLETARPTASVMPLAPTMLAALTPKGHDVSLVDMFAGDEVDYDTDSKLVALSVRTPLASIAYGIADAFLARGKIVVLGGPHVFACPGEARQHATAVAIGEGEELWPRILQDAEQNAEVMRDGYSTGRILRRTLHAVRHRPSLAIAKVSFFTQLGLRQAYRRLYEQASISSSPHA
jgi:radical SAM superfamily enzyme YgiQ (UPF0313 family)